MGWETEVGRRKRLVPLSVHLGVETFLDEVSDNEGSFSTAPPVHL